MRGAELEVSVTEIRTTRPTTHFASLSAPELSVPAPHALQPPSRGREGVEGAR